MRNASMKSAFGVLLGLFLSVQSTSGQLPGASPATLGTAYNYTALARGFAAIGLNPAGLGLPETEGVSFSLFPVQVSQFLDPLTFSDILDYKGVLLPGSVKEGWVNDIAAAGGQNGLGRLEVTAFSLSWGHLGLQLSTIASGYAHLTDSAAELLLFGNAGRTGDAGDFEIEGSILNGYAVTTLGVSYGFPLARRWVPGVEQGLSLGFTIKQSWGHGVVFAEDAGTKLLQSDPLRINLNFPVIYPGGEGGNFSKGSGMGVDVGVAWERGPWAASAAVLNIVHSFEWDLTELVYRPGLAVFDGNENNSSFEAVAAGEAPPDLRNKIADMTFKPSIVLAGAYDALENLSVSAEIKQRTGDGLDTGPKSHIGLGLEYFPTPTVPIRAGFAAITDGFQFGGGLGVVLGPVHLGLAGLYQTGDVGDGLAGTFGISFVRK